MSEWYYAKGGAQSGPVNFEQLRDLARNGNLAAGDLVWTSSMKDWQPAAQVDGLIATPGPTGQPAADPSNPYAAPQSAWNEPAPAAGSTLQEIVPGSEPIDAVACVKRGFELTKRNFGTILLVGITYILISFGVSFLCGLIDSALGFGPGQAGSPSNGGFDRTQFQQGGGPVTAIIGNIFSILLSLGLVRIGLNLVSGKQVSVAMLFGEGRKLITAIVASILFFLMIFVGFLLLIVPGVYLMLRYGHYMAAIVDKNMGIIESLTYSSSITTNSRLNLFLLALLSIAVFIAGALALLVGLIFAYPVIWLSWMVAFRCMQYGSRALEDQPGTRTPLLGNV